MERTFIDELKSEFVGLDEAGQDFDRELIYFPDLVKLLCDLLDTDIVDEESRILINAALGYVLAPNDVVPEDVYGAYGYMDDMYITCVIINMLKDKYHDLITKLWNHDDEQFDTTLGLCTYKSEKFLEEKNIKDKILRYCGLSD